MVSCTKAHATFSNKSGSGILDCPTIPHRKNVTVVLRFFDPTQQIHNIPHVLHWWWHCDLSGPSYSSCSRTAEQKGRHFRWHQHESALNQPGWIWMSYWMRYTIIQCFRCHRCHDFFFHVSIVDMSYSHFSDTHFRVGTDGHGIRPRDLLHDFFQVDRWCNFCGAEAVVFVDKDAWIRVVFQKRRVCN